METKIYTWRTRQELEICQDCVFTSENGSPDYVGYVESGHAERYAQAVKHFGDEPVTTNGEEHFSRHSCDFCGDSLGGSRYVASVMQLHQDLGN